MKAVFLLKPLTILFHFTYSMSHQFDHEKLNVYYEAWISSAMRQNYWNVFRSAPLFMINSTGLQPRSR